MKATLEPYSFIADFNYQYTAPPLPTATVLGTTNLCIGDDTDIIIVLTGTGPWNFTYTDGTTPVNIVGTNTNPYIVTVSPVVNTTYSVTAVSDAFGVGTDFGADAIIAVYAPATCSAGVDQTICATEDVTLAGSIGGSAVSAIWSGGAGVYNPNNTTLNAIYTPSAGEQLAGSVTLTLTTNDPLGPCSAVNDSILITINPQLFDDEPIVSPNGTAYLLCSNQLNLSLKNPVEFEFWFYLNQFITVIGGFETFFEVQNNLNNYATARIIPDNAIYGIFRKALAFTYKVNGTQNIYYFQNYFNIVPGWYKIKFIWSGTSLSCYRNDILFGSYVADNLNNMIQDAGCDMKVLDSIAGGIPIQPNNKLCSFKYKTNGVLIVHYPICEEGGNAAYNVVMNNYHLGGQAGYNALTWNRDNNFAKYLRDYGYRLTGGIYIPGLLDGSSAADGNTLTEWSPCTEFN